MVPDGSRLGKHGWFSDERWNDLLVILGNVVDLSLSIHDFENGEIRCN
jgi:hypothetical protein